MIFAASKNESKKGQDMKFYDIDAVFTFGKYEGMTIALSLIHI